MKNSNYTLILFLALALATITSCSSPAEKVDTSKENVEQAKQDLEKAKADYEIQYNAFMAESNEKITANEKLIIDLKKYTKNKKKETKIAYEKSIADLETRNQQMKDKMNNYKDEGKDKWDAFKLEFNHDMDNLGSAINDLSKNNTK
ncbi:MAG: hypothetical protein KBE91_09825 [Bacteroidia bacterium]|nr:hypothetical protein [Bacteroidia bacterium]